MVQLKGHILLRGLTDFPSLWEPQVWIPGCGYNMQGPWCACPRCSLYFLRFPPGLLERGSSMHYPVLLATIGRSSEGHLTQTREYQFPSLGFPSRISCPPTMSEVVITMSTLGHLCSHASLQMAWKAGGGQSSQATRGRRSSETAEPGKKNTIMSECPGLTFPGPSLILISGGV